MTNKGTVAVNNPENLVIEIDEQRAWINQHKLDTGMPWSTLQKKTGLTSTLSVFAGGNYGGDEKKIAESIFRYRQLLLAQAEVKAEMPELPPFFETPTSRRITTMLSLAQRGRITLIAGGPGNSKTQTILNYQASVANVWVATLAPSSSGVNNMQIEVLEALGEPEARGTPQALTRRIRARVRNTGGLIVVDEAQHASEKALEEIRSWHDATGIGICLCGNRDVLLRLEHGSRKEAFARLASRVSQRLILNVSTEGDAMALADAWGIEDGACRSYIVNVALRPGSLRNATMMLETAFMLATSQNDVLQLSHLEDAWSMLSTRQLAA